MKQNNFKCYNS